MLLLVYLYACTAMPSAICHLPSSTGHTSPFLTSTKPIFRFARTTLSYLTDNLPRLLSASSWRSSGTRRPPNAPLLLSGVTYSYVHLPTASTLKPTILFVPGFPSSSFDWRHQIAHFAALGYGVLAPDLRGYGSTSRPSSPSAYKGKVMANHLAELLSHEKIGKVHGVAHDFGSPLLGRLVAYFPESLLS